MKLLLMSGLGPYTVNSQTINGTLLSPYIKDQLRDDYTRMAGQPVDLRTLWYGGPSGYPVLRPRRGTLPHLPTETVRSIIESTDVDYELFDLEDLWLGNGEPKGGHFDIVGLSTTFICDRGTLAMVLDWITKRFPGASVVLGGQYSNLKYDEIMKAFPAVDYVICGDAEVALPMFLRALAGKCDLSDVPNLVWRGLDGGVVAKPVEYIDVNEHSSPTFTGTQHVIPYESMRGCPYTCKYCSFPAASPKWRYKSVEKICSDWRSYADKNGASVVRSMDSTFTIPHTRFKRLLEVLPEMDIGWEAYTRANTISSKEIVEGLEASRCEWLLIGFESMSDKTLKAMDKKVSASQNERAFNLLAESNVALRTSFIVGYPGETPEDYELSHRFLVDRFRGRFGIHSFVLVDETMPVWEDAEMHQLEVTSPVAWKHKGMDSNTALELREKTLFEARWQNDEGVHSGWQVGYERPLVPDVDLRTNYRVEKLIERLAFVQKDWGCGQAGADRCRSILVDMERLGIRLDVDAARNYQEPTVWGIGTVEAQLSQELLKT